MILVVFCTGCKNKAEEKHLSDLIDLKNEKIERVYCPIFSPAIVQNDKYVFYETGDTNIIRINKSDHKKSIILQLEKSNGSEGGLCLSKDFLYFVHDNSLYKCDFDGKKVEKMISKQDLKKLKSIQSIDGVKLYKGNIYIYILVNGLGFSDMILKLHPDTKEFDKVAEVEEPCFYKNSLYYICNKKNEKTTIYSYSGSQKDKKKYTFSSNPGSIIYNSTKAGGFDCDWDNPQKSYMQVYDLNTGKEKKTLLPEDFSFPDFLIDDILLYPFSTKKGIVLKELKIQ